MEDQYPGTAVSQNVGQLHGGQAPVQGHGNQVGLGGAENGLYELVALDYGDYPTFLSSFYYSVVTLTTLGYGDVLPASPAAQIVAMVEVALGYVMLGGLLSIFSNKMARRAD